MSGVLLDVRIVAYQEEKSQAGQMMGYHKWTVVVNLLQHPQQIRRLRVVVFPGLMRGEESLHFVENVFYSRRFHLLLEEAEKNGLCNQVPVCGTSQVDDERLDCVIVELSRDFFGVGKESNQLDRRPFMPIAVTVKSVSYKIQATPC